MDREPDGEPRPFEIFDATTWPRIGTEQMGTKRKFWCRHPAGHKCLFKFSRTHAGEDWSEKIAAEVAALLEIPHAEIELATCRIDGVARRGTISRDFTREKTYGSLIHGNELLLEQDPKYPQHGHNFHVAQHTLDRIFRVLERPFIHPPEGMEFPPGIASAGDLFAGYLLLDALIVNTDRHHTNWGILLRPPAADRRRAELAPTFDHASSLGRELTDRRRAYMMRAEGMRNNPRKPSRRDQTIVGYLEKDEGRSRIFGSEKDAKPLRPLAVFRAAREKHFTAAEAWLDRLESLDVSKLREIVDRVPREAMTSEARGFSVRLMELTRAALISRTFHYG